MKKKTKILVTGVILTIIMISIVTYFVLVPENVIPKSETQVKFRIINSTGEPISNTNVTICDNSIKIDPEICCPYCNESYREIYGTYITDEYGILYLDIKNIDVYPPSSIVLEVGKDYNIILIEHSDTLSHTYSPNHVRILYYESGNLISNRLYNLDTNQVTEIFVSDGSEETYTFDTIDLII